MMTSKKKKRNKKRKIELQAKSMEKKYRESFKQVAGKYKEMNENEEKIKKLKREKMEGGKVKKKIRKKQLSN